MSDEGMSDDGPCTDYGDTGITYQTERVCSCLAGLAIEMIDADACPTPIDRITSLEAQLLAAERERDALREALRNPPKHVYWGAGEPDCPRDILASNGELHTLRCKVCGKGLSEGRICLAGLPK